MKRLPLIAFVVVLAVAVSVFADAVPNGPRGIIPFAGSTVGSNGPQFSMSVRLYGKEGLRGEILFHPAGQVANNRTDPMWRYSCGPSGICLWSGDIVHDMLCQPDTPCSGGVGSLEIFPDAGSEQVVPTAITRLFVLNSSVPGGIAQFGTVVPQIDREEWLNAQSQTGATRSLYVPAASEQMFRRNVGLRTLTDVTYSVYTRTVDGVLSAPIQHTLPANYTLLQPINDFVGRPVGDMDDVLVTIDSGSAIPFYTYTHNYTNEPTLVVGQPTTHSAFVVNPQ